MAMAHEQVCMSRHADLAMAVSSHFRSCGIGESVQNWTGSRAFLKPQSEVIRTFNHNPR